MAWSTFGAPQSTPANSGTSWTVPSFAGDTSNSYSDVPSLNQALKSGQINKQQWQTQFKVIQNKLPGNKPIGPTSGFSAVKTYGPSALGQAITSIPKGVAVGLNQGLVQPLQHQVTKQFQYLSGPTSTQQQRTSITQNQQKVQAASPKTQDLFKQAPVSAKVQAAQLLTQGHKESAVQAYLNKQVALGNQQTLRGAGVGLQLASLGVAGGATAGLTKAFARSVALNAAAGGAGTAGNTLTTNPKATGKQLVKSGVTGAVAGAGLSVAGGLLGRAVADARIRVAANKSETKTPPLATTPANQGLGEAGAVNPGAAVEDMQKMIANHQKINAASESIDKNSAKLEGNKQVIETQTAQNFNKLPELNKAQNTELQAHFDAKAAGLEAKPLSSPELQQHADAIVQLNKAMQVADAARARAEDHPDLAAKIESRDPTTYIHREPIGKGSNLEQMLRNTRKSPSSIGILGRKTASSNKRTLMALTDEQGNRSSVLIDKNKVTQLANGGKTRTELGNLNLKSNAARMQQDLKPTQAKIDALEKEQKILSSTKSRSLAASKRLANIKTSLQSAYREHANITNKYDINEMDGKSFVDKNGKKYTFGQATIAENTKNAGQKYFVNPTFNTHLAYADSLKAYQNSQFMTSTKKLLEDKGLAVKDGEGTAPRGFKRTTNPYFQNYRLTPDLAYMLNDIAGRSGEEHLGTRALDLTNNVLRQTIVWAPIRHDANMLAQYFVDRGLTGVLRPVSMVKGLKTAVEAVATHNQFYQDTLKTGFKLVGGKDDMAVIAQKALKDSLDSQDRLRLFAKTTGLNPIKLYKAVQGLSVFDVQDVLSLARIAERQKGTILRKGTTLEDAAANTAKYNFQYTVPSKVLGSRTASRFLSRGTYFGAYTFDKFRIVGNILKTTANLKHPAEAAEAADKLAALLFVSAVAWPAVDKGLQKITGNPNTHVTAPGSASVTELAQKLIQHKAGGAQIASQISIAAPFSLGAQLYDGHDAFTGAPIHDPNASPTQKVTQTLSWLKSQLSPVQKLNSSKNIKSNKALGTALALIGVSNPKNSPYQVKIQSLAFDSLPLVQKQAKAKAATGDTQGAQKLINSYNAQVLTYAIKDLQSQGKSVPDTQTLINQLKKSHYYYEPKQSTIQKWTQPKQPTKDGFTL